MKFHRSFGLICSGLAAGVVSGLFGAGGGMILVPMLTHQTDLTEDEIFPASISIILPICMISLLITAAKQPLPFSTAIPYLIGSAAGGFLASLWGRMIPTLWLHRILGALILWGGIRYLC